MSYDPDVLEEATTHDHDTYMNASLDDSVSSYPPEPIRRPKRARKETTAEYFSEFLQDVKGIIAEKSSSNDQGDEATFFAKMLEQKLKKLPSSERMELECSFLNTVNKRLCELERQNKFK